MIAWLATSAFADRYWDVKAADARALARQLAPGTIVVTWCQQCGGDLRIVRVRSARVAPGTYADDEGRKSVVVERDVLFAGTNPASPTLGPEARCGGGPEDQADPIDGAPGSTDHVDLPYSFVLDPKGRLDWLGRRSASDFGGIPPKVDAMPAEFLARIQACATPR